MSEVCIVWRRNAIPVLSGQHYSKLAERLAKKIYKELGIECDPNTFRRTYAGYWQRSQGTWL